MISDTLHDIHDRKLAGVMIHADLRQAFSFLSLPRYARQQRKRLNDELKGLIRFQDWCMGRYDMMMAADVAAIPREHVIPDAWLRHSRFDVSAQDRQRGLKEGLERWVEWERGTVVALQSACKVLADAGEADAQALVLGMTGEVGDELSLAKSELLHANAVGFDMSVLASME